MLRRNINKLLDPAYAQELGARLEYMRTILVPTCYRWVVLCKRGGGEELLTTAEIGLSRVLLREPILHPWD